MHLSTGKLISRDWVSSHFSWVTQIFGWWNAARIGKGSDCTFLFPGIVPHVVIIVK